MKNTVRVTVLVENTARQQGLLGEHGLAFWIDTGSHRVLFDTGQGQTLVPNARRLRIDLASADAIVLSHGHYDHTGGLGEVFHLAIHAKLYLHPQSVVRRYAGHQGQGRAIGLAAATADQLLQTERRLVWITQPTEVVSGILASGEIPRATKYEDTGGDFFLDTECNVADPILDDQALYLDTEAGIVVLLGCAHAGVVNTLDYIRMITARPIHAVLGGTHLINASPQRMAQTIAALRDLNLQLIAPAHCTGPRAMAA
ncbi:MAG: MBL fold metallo-hydrolase [Phycisphaerae bacterium]